MMITKTLHIIIALWAIALACASCSQEDITVPVSKGDGQVKIVYKVAGTSLSRAPELGWGDEDKDGTDEWHENIINRIDLFVFHNNENKILFKHISSTGSLGVNAESEQTFTQNELTYNDVTTGDYIYYMVVNCEFDDNDIVEGTFTLDDLKAEITPVLTFNGKQTSFAMDGKIEGAPVPVDNVVTLSFELNRAAAKIRVSVVDKDGKSIMGQCKFRLHNYILNGTSVLAEAESNIYGDGGWQTRVPESANLAWNGVLRKDNQAVFYSYPNDWFDEELLIKEGEHQGEFIEEDTYAKDDLIDETKQTYIMVTYENNAYKVPVNFSISSDNDKTSFTADYIETEIRDKYYRIKRNHIYDITATIDIVTNTVTVEKEILVNAWEDKENMDVTFGSEEEGQ